MTLDTFIEKFDLFADAPDAVAKMRELVRHLAVTGTLIDQNDNDEPALALLDRIAAHKTALAKEGKLRGQTTVSPMSLDEDTSVLPSSWTWVRFGEIMVNRDGERIPVSKEKRATKAKTYDYYGASGVIDKIDGYLFDKPLLLIGEDGANLINRSTPIAFMARGQYWVNNHAHVLDGICEDFLRYIELHINAINLESYVTGSAQPKMNQAKMNSIPIALPPLAEQKRIVAKVDELMALCDRLEAQQQERETRHAALARASLARFADAPTPANLNFLFHSSFSIQPSDLRKSILTLAVQGKLVPQDPNGELASKFLRRLQVQRKDSFEAEVMRARREGVRPPRAPRNGFAAHIDEENPDLPYTWCVTRVGDVSDCLDYLRVPVNKGERLAASGTVPYYGANGQVGWIDKHLFDEDLVLVVEDETFIGRIKPFSYVIRGKSWVNNHAHVLRPLGGMTADFLNLVLCRYPFIPLTSGTTNRRKLTQPSLMDAQISLPPLAEQRRIVAKVEQLMALVDALETQLAASRATAASLLEALVAEFTAA